MIITHIPEPPRSFTCIVATWRVRQIQRGIDLMNTPPIPLHLGADGVWRRRPIHLTVEDMPPITVEDIQRLFTMHFKF